MSTATVDWKSYWAGMAVGSAAAACAIPAMRYALGTAESATPTAATALQGGTMAAAFVDDESSEELKVVLLVLCACNVHAYARIMLILSH
jgi:hypothetical protein